MDSELQVLYLKKRINEVFDQIPQPLWKKYNKITLENFVTYFPHVKAISERDEIHNNICNYLGVIAQTFEEPYDLRQHKILFEQYLYPVARKFEWRQGFVPFPTMGAFVYLNVLFWMVAFLLWRVNFYLFLALVCFYIIYVVVKTVKFFQRKFYGLGW